LRNSQNFSSIILQHFSATYKSIFLIFLICQKAAGKTSVFAHFLRRMLRKYYANQKIYIAAEKGAAFAAPFVNS